MKRALPLVLVTLAALACRSAFAAEVTLIEPQDKSVVKGVVTFRLQEQHLPNEEFFSNPVVQVQDASGRVLRELTAVRDNKTGICLVTMDTRPFPDGVYLFTTQYKALRGGDRLVTAPREDFCLSFRNHGFPPGRFDVTVPAQPVKLADQAEISVHVHDTHGRSIPGAKVSFKVDRGDLTSEQELTTDDGTCNVLVSADEAGPVTVTITVENLPPVTRVVRFAE